MKGVFGDNIRDAIRIIKGDKMETTVTMGDGCPYCSSESCQVYHQGKCPKVKSIEYHEDGTVKRVEFEV